MLRFVILNHEMPAESGRADHYDLMLEREVDGPLLTWELPEFPAVGCEYTARQLPPHRREYLEYDGPVSGNRGHVSRVASGTCEWKATESGGVDQVILAGSLAAILTIELTGGTSEMFRLMFSKPLAGT